MKHNIEGPVTLPRRSTPCLETLCTCIGMQPPRGLSLWEVTMLSEGGVQQPHLAV